MINKVADYFKEHPNSSVLFLFEDIDYYVETTKQLLLYKILDMLQYCQIKFVFLATSMKLDIADSFEKRIKSRFSHRQVLLYSLNIKTFDRVLDQVFDENVRRATKIREGDLTRAFRDLKALANSGLAKELREIFYDSGK